MSSDFIHLPHRTVIALKGQDVIALLERLVTNATTDWAEGETRYGALLTPQGKIIADYLAVRTDDGVLLDVAKAYAADLAKRLRMFRLRSQVDIELREDLHVAASIESQPVGFDGAAFNYQDPRYPDGRARALCLGTAQQGATDSLALYHADRVANGVPEQDADFGTASVFPADINMDILDGVALNKGCFVGQEVVSRMHRRGKIRKRTLRLEMTASTSVQTGDAVNAPLSIGTVTSAAPGQALAVIRVDRLASAEQAGETVTVNQTPVSLEIPAWLATERTAMEGT